MQIIRTAEAFARLLATHPNTELRALLQAQADRLAEYADYDMEELAMFAILQSGDDLNRIDAALGWSLLDSEGSFSHPVELINRHSGWYEAPFILSDDGFGLVLFVPIDERTDSRLLEACKRALIEA